MNRFLIPSIVPPLVLESIYGISHSLSMVLLSVLVSAYDIPQNSSGVPPSMPLCNHGINIIYGTLLCRFSTFQTYYFSSFFGYNYVPQNIYLLCVLPSSTTQFVKMPRSFWLISRRIYIILNPLSLMEFLIVPIS